MNRKEVEHYLHTRNVEFRQTCCVDSSELSTRGSWDDLTKIGEEGHPWFCSEHNVYVAFQFTDHTKKVGVDFEADDMDTLKAITLYHWLEGCL
jgi:hypothetical protein